MLYFLTVFPAINFKISNGFLDINNRTKIDNFDNFSQFTWHHKNQRIAFKSQIKVQIFVIQIILYILVLSVLSVNFPGIVHCVERVLKT